MSESKQAAPSEATDAPVAKKQRKAKISTNELSEFTTNLVNALALKITQPAFIQTLLPEFGAITAAYHAKMNIDNATTHHKKGKKRVREEKLPRDETKPKQIANPYLRFHLQNRDEIVKEFGGVNGNKNVTGKSGELWREMTKEQRMPYQLEYDAEKVAYDAAIKAWKAGKAVPAPSAEEKELATVEPEEAAAVVDKYLTADDIEAAFRQEENGGDDGEVEAVMPPVEVAPVVVPAKGKGKGGKKSKKIVIPDSP